MRSAKRVGRVIGGLLFAQPVGLTLAFVWLMPITTPDFLEGAAGVAFKIRAAVLLVIDCWFFVFHGLLFRSSVVPRAGRVRSVNGRHSRRGDTAAGLTGL